MSSSIRTRWAAIGAAIAVTIGAGGGFGFARASVSSGERAVFVPITPCRILDTRPAPRTVGLRTAPLGPAENYPVSARGAAGNCSLPTDASALVLNVTAVGATAQTNLRIFPTGATLPTASNLNPAPGAPPTPNSVTTDLSPSGQFTVYNAAGSVNVIIDVNGYYVDHNHDDRYYTKAQTQAVAATVDDVAEVVIAPRPPYYTFAPELIPVETPITTTVDGRLDIRMTAMAGIVCSPNTGSNRGLYLTIDGVGVATSLVRFPSGESSYFGMLSGITDGVVAAGVHDIGIGFECNDANVATLSAIYTGTQPAVIVLND